MRLSASVSGTQHVVLDHRVFILGLDPFLINDMPENQNREGAGREGEKKKEEGKTEASFPYEVKMKH